MEKKLKKLWSVIILVFMALVVAHLVWSAKTTLFITEEVIEHTFTTRK